jgi:hypothetical protein
LSPGAWTFSLADGLSDWMAEASIERLLKQPSSAKKSPLLSRVDLNTKKAA